MDKTAQHHKFTNGLGCQDSSGGVYSTDVDLRSSQAVHLNMKNACRISKQSVNVVSSVSTTTVSPLLNLTKERPFACPMGPKEFHQRENKCSRRQIETNNFKFEVM